MIFINIRYLSSLKIGDTMHSFCLSSPVDNLETFYFGATGL
jgi:hypothetical protein